uniref:NADH-ubiquinone oxidoreductase chain 5 n=1 Tax=Yuukianura szeptyckii TaxID=1453868 RepID=A0A7T0M4F2_9HEXA|nr:NADH dehydrogenase subunit 5 [Yuukianura szeptyckii]QPL15827.1 NADH dehydrogenase subunit 5 [Yuukianura szeptyckii]
MLSMKLFSKVSNSIFFIYSCILLITGVMFIIMGGYMHLMDKVTFLEWIFLTLNSVSVMYTILLDWVSLIFCGVVSIISSMVLIYSHYYMYTDQSKFRFVILVTLFVASMMLMVLSPNMISILLGWDGLGLVSYGLVVYYQNVKSANAGMLTVLSNRLGDIAILVSISWLLNYGSWDFFYIQFLTPNSSKVGLVLMLVVIASMTKSAQVPFSAWLPAAMAAPTPISALVHSSTLVTAGVYLLIRFHLYLGINKYLMYISLLTLVMSGVGASYEFDLKKIIALSTLSQLGVMMFSLSVGMWELAFFHLISHATFKSLLFLCAGVYIHSFNDTQDIRGLGLNLMSYPMTGVYFIGCSLSICGFPFLAGFYSKDLILEAFMYGDMSIICFMMVVVGMMSTIIYSVRLIYYLYMKGSKISSVFSWENDFWVMISMTCLFTVSLMVGSSFIWVLLPLYILNLPIYFKCMILSLSLFLVMFTLMNLFKKSIVGKKDMNKMKQVFLWFMGMMWMMPFTSTLAPMKMISIGKTYLKLLDMGWLEKLGGQGGMSLIMKSSTILEKWNVLYLKLYLFIVLFTLLIV